MRTTIIRVGLAALVAALGGCSADVFEKGGVPDNGGAGTGVADPGDTVGAASEALVDVPSEVTIQSASYSGSGCPADSVHLKISTDEQLLYVDFDQLVAQTGPGQSIDRKNCELRFTLHVPPGWTVALSRVAYRGHAGLQAGVVGEQKSSYFFAGKPIHTDAAAMTRLVGPYFDDYARSDGSGVLDYSPCGAVDPMLVINAQVRVQGIEGQMTLDSIIGYHFAWKKCLERLTAG
jgi:hypothetical protein